MLLCFTHHAEESRRAKVKKSSTGYFMGVYAFPVSLPLRLADTLIACFGWLFASDPLARST